MLALLLAGGASSASQGHRFLPPLAGLLAFVVIIAYLLGLVYLSLIW
jgi:hypothetical protein